MQGLPVGPIVFSERELKSVLNGAGKPLVQRQIGSTTAMPVARRIS